MQSKRLVKPYINRNTELTKTSKNGFKKYFFNLMNNPVFGKTMENVKRHRDIKLLTTERERYYFVSEPNYHTTRRFFENFLTIEMKKIKVFMNKPVYLAPSILEISKIAMHEFWYDYMKPKYGFEWVKKAPTFNEDFIKIIAKVVIESIFLKVMSNILNNQTNCTMIYHFYHKK